MCKKGFRRWRKLKSEWQKQMVKSKSRILIIEDDENIRESLNILLQLSGYKVDKAKNGQEALQKIIDHVYNLALIDINLPDMQGTELLGRLQDKMPDIVKILITGYPCIQNVMKALNEGADAYIKKPFKPEKLIALIEEKLEKQRRAEKMIDVQITDWIKTRTNKSVEKGY